MCLKANNCLQWSPALTTNDSLFVRVRRLYLRLVIERYTCDTTDAFGMVGFEEVESLKTFYQDLDFSVRHDTDDLCMSLVRICISSFVARICLCICRFVDV
jgi:hypothetical protein